MTCRSEAMRVAAEIGERLARAAERRLGVDHPIDAAQFGETRFESIGIGEAGERTGEAQPAGFMGVLQVAQEQPAEQARENPHRKEESGAAGDPARAIERGAAAGRDAMDMRVMSESLAPGVEHCGDADAGAKMVEIGGDRDQRLGGGAEQDGVDGGLVVEGDRGDRRRQREDDVEVRDRQEFSLTLGEPLGARQALTLRTVPVAAGIVGDAGRPAVAAA